MGSQNITASWRLTYLLLSIGVAFIGSYLTVSLADMYRLSSSIKPRYLTQDTILVLMAISIGGVGIWTMHFVGMGALVLEDSDGNIVKRQFDITTTVLSLLCAIVLTYAGLYVSSRDRVYSKTREEVFEMLIDDAKGASMAAIRKKSTLIRMALLKGINRIVIGGIAAAAGVCVMHYIGMVAVVSSVTIQWNIGVVFASVVIAIIAACAAFWILFRLLALYPEYESLRIASALIATAAVCGMHYVGMAAATYKLRENGSVDHETLGGETDSETAVMTALGSSMIFSFTVVMVMFSEKRLWLLNFLNANRKVNKLMQHVRNDPKFGKEHFVVEYFCATEKLQIQSSIAEVNGKTSLYQGTFSANTASRSQVKVAPGRENELILTELRNECHDNNDETGTAENTGAVKIAKGVETAAVLTSATTTGNIACHDDAIVDFA